MKSLSVRDQPRPGQLGGHTGWQTTTRTVFSICKDIGDDRVAPEAFRQEQSGAAHGPGVAGSHPRDGSRRPDSWQIHCARPRAGRTPPDASSQPGASPVSQGGGVPDLAYGAKTEGDSHGPLIVMAGGEAIGKASGR